MASYAPLYNQQGQNSIQPVSTGAQLSGGPGSAGGAPASGAQPATPGGAPAGAPGAAPMAQGAGTGFINLQNVLAANGPAGAQMAGQMTDKAGALGRVAQGEINGQPGSQAPGNTDDAQEAWRNSDQDAAKAAGFTGDKTHDAQAAQDYAKSLGSYAGLQATLQKQYAGQAYTPGMSGMDAFLAQQGGGQDLQNAASAYGDLTKRLGAYGPATPPEIAATKGSSSMNDGRPTRPYSGPASPAPVPKTPRKRPHR